MVKKTIEYICDRCGAIHITETHSTIRVGIIGCVQATADLCEICIWKFYNEYLGKTWEQLDGPWRVDEAE